MNQRHFSAWILFGFLLVLSILAGCDGIGPALATTTPSPTPLATCIPTPSDFFTKNEGANKDVTDIADSLFVDFLEARANGDQGWLERIKSQSFQLLYYQAKRWTKIHDEPIGENGKMRLIITFVSPQLVRAAILNHAIYKNSVANDNLNEYTKQALQYMDSRNDYFFLITVQSEGISDSSATIQLPAENFALRGTSGVQAPSVRSDSFLTQPLNLSSGTYAGFIYFTFGQRHFFMCEPVLDAQRDTSITLVIQNVRIGENKPKSIVTEITLMSPVLPGGGAVPTPDPSVVIDPGLFSPTATLQPISAENTIYWNDLTRFIWAKLTLDNASTP